MLAYDYPLLGAFWTVLWIFIWVMWIFLLFRIIADVFRDHELSGWGKAGWLIFLLFLPFLGAFVYVIARGSGMGQRDIEAAQAQNAAFQAYVRDAAGTGGTGGTADELVKLADLRERGVISDAEFEQQKAKILS